MKILLSLALLMGLMAAALAQPVITPANLTVNAGASFDFTATDANALAFQWVFDGTNISGATNSELYVDNPGTNQAGLYWVVATYADNSIRSNSAALNVLQGTIVNFAISKFADGSTSNLLVELFNHDKPATVENFIHYITSGSYSNMFFDRDVAGFVLQGGDYVTYDRSTNGLNGGPVSTGTNIFPSQVDSEFNVGPLIHNTFGTIAMALVSGEPNSATSAFFFNLADNSTNLDNQNGGFTVFGRILSGSNILQYFNTLSAPSNGIFDLNSSIPTLPVNDDSTNEPTDANLFYCDFTFQTPPPVDTIPPTVSITFPAPNAAFTNGNSLTVQGIAQDNVGLAEVFCVVTSTNAAYGGQSQTNAALGTTNWSLNLGTLPPGIYQCEAFAQDGAGNLSAPTTEYFTNMAVLTVITNLNGQLTTSAPQILVPGWQYSVMAAPGPGEQFYTWTSNGVTLLNPLQTFTATDNLTLTVTYLPNNLSAGLTITGPLSGTQALSIQSVLTVSGTIASTNVTQLTCQFFVNSNSISAAQPANILGTNWSLTVTNYANGSYTVAALASNTTGESSFVTANFTLLNVELLTLHIEGEGTVARNPGPYVVPGTYTLKAVPKPGQEFYCWNDGFTSTLNSSKTIDIVSNLTLTATFVPKNNSLKGITFTAPPANAQLTNPVVTLAGRTKSSITATQIVCQLFLNSNSLAPPSPAGIANDTWSAPQTNLAPGQSSLAPGAYTAVATAYDATGKSALIRENFDVLARLTVATSTNLVVPPVLDTNGVNTNIVTVASPLQAGAVSLKSKYLKVGASATIRAAPKPGYLFAYWDLNGVANGDNPYSFSLTTNETITANFAPNYYSKVSGTYYGLFYPSYTYATPDNAGYFTMKILSGGAATVDLSFPDYTYKFEGQLPYNCGVQPEVTSGLHGSPSDPLILSFAMDLTNFSGAFTGYVYDAKGTWGANLTAYRAATKLTTNSAVAPGRYVLTIPGDHANANNQPGGDSYAVYSISDSGAVALAGSLADNTTFTRSTGVSTNGIWPLYVPLYKTHGIILGWQTNSSPTNFSGQVEWDKPAKTGAYYPDGFTNVFPTTPANYTPPVADTQYQIVFNGGALTGPLTNFLTVTSAHLFTPDPAQAGLKVTLTPATGALTGQFMDPAGNTVKKIRGAFISPGSGGSGYILDADDETGYFEISLLP